MSIFSWKVLRTVFGFALAVPDDAVVEAITSVERPARSHQADLSCGLKTSGTRAGRGSTRARPNWPARSYPSEVAPSLGMESPPVATTSEAAAKLPAEVSTRKRAAEE